MATINLKSIKEKIYIPKAGTNVLDFGFNKGRVISLKGKKGFEEIINKATSKLSYCFYNAKESAGFNDNALIAIGEMDFSPPQEDPKIQGRYIIYGYIEKNMRESLVPQLYPEGAEDMAALMNNGYDADNQVYGIWHGKKTASLTTRPVKHFVQRAISDFNGNYGSELNATAELVNKDRFEKNTNTILGT